MNEDRDTVLREALLVATRALEVLARNRAGLLLLDDDERKRLLMAAGQVSRPGAEARRQLTLASDKKRRAERRAKAEAQLAQTGIRSHRKHLLPGRQPDAPKPGDDDAPRLPGGEVPVSEAATETLGEARNCYICKASYEVLHHFYDALCPTCANLNWRKRSELADLRGRVAVVTGARIKIGYQAGLKLLRSGARLVATTRFPRDAASRYAREPDFEQWRERLEIYGLDLRHTPSVEAFCSHLEARYERLDFLLNNACQTVRRPPAFYAHMMEGEARALGELPAEARSLLEGYEALRRQDPSAERALSATDDGVRGITEAAALSQLRLIEEDALAGEALFPEGALDDDLQQIDMRHTNSWRLHLAEVSSVELIEVHLVNAVAPFVLNARLKPLMARTPERDKHIVNVSAMEGQFYRTFKTTRHPHTNMAKAALNMMTRTSAPDYLAAGIHMNSVDTGWITDEDPTALAAAKRTEQRFHPPLDNVDAGARICDPIIDGFNTGQHVWGLFLKDYAPTRW